MIPVAIAQKLHLLATGAQVPASGMSHPIISEMVAEGIISQRIAGRTRRTLYVADAAALGNYLYNKYQVADLPAYIAAMADAGTVRAGLIQVSADSKAAARRTFKGFLVNSYLPVPCMLHGAPLTILPPAGTFQFISDYEGFVPPVHAVIVGVENAESFSRVVQQQHLFPGIMPLFVSRYPQQQGPRPAEVAATGAQPLPALWRL